MKIYTDQAPRQVEITTNFGRSPNEVPMIAVDGVQQSLSVVERALLSLIGNLMARVRELEGLPDQTEMWFGEPLPPVSRRKVGLPR